MTSRATTALVEVPVAAVIAEAVVTTDVNRVAVAVAVAVMKDETVAEVAAAVTIAETVAVVGVVVAIAPGGEGMTIATLDEILVAATETVAVVAAVTATTGTVDEAPVGLAAPIDAVETASGGTVVGTRGGFVSLCMRRERGASYALSV